MHNLLAVINPEDRENADVKRFFETLPKGSVVYEASGCTGSIYDYERYDRAECKCDQPDNVKSRFFALCRVPSLETIAADYFSKKEDVCLVNIGDELKLRVMYVHLGFANGTICSALHEYTGSIRDVIFTYNEILKDSSFKIFLKELNKSSLKNHVLKKRLFGGHRLKHTVGYIGLGISDDKFQIDIFCLGGYKGKIPEGYIST